MVGISLALALQRALPSAAITLVESAPLVAGGKAIPPSFDARSTALSQSSRSIYEMLGIWPALAAHSCPIDTIHVSARGRVGSTVLRAADYGWPALGYVIENARLGTALLTAVAGSTVALRGASQVTAVRMGAAGATLDLQSAQGSSTLDCTLLVLADGADSALRHQLGIEAERKPYEQTAIIANVASALPHAGCAWERFTSTGPLALLPLTAVPDAAHRLALVWTLPEAAAGELLAADDADFLRALQGAFGYRLGRLQRVGQRHSYPLALTRSREQVRSNLVVMGNAAHALHPVAGQGFNLALRGIAALATTLASAPDGRSLGDVSLLQQYEARQASDQRRTVALSDRLPAIFALDDPLLGLLRDLALAGLDVLEGPKRAFTQHAAGIAQLATLAHE